MTWEIGDGGQEPCAAMARAAFGGVGGGGGGLCRCMEGGRPCDALLPSEALEA